MLKQQQEQRQRLAIDVQQMQQIKLLEVSGEELADRIREELATNPALEVVEESEETTPEDNFLDEEPLSTPENEQEGIQDDFSPEDFTADDEREDALRELPRPSAGDDDGPSYVQPNEAPSLSDELHEQLISLTLSDRERMIAEYIIGNLSDDGYLSASLHEISDALLFNENLDASDAEIEQMIHRIQQLDPPGIAARDLRESLLLQLRRLPKDEVHSLALSIIEGYFEDLAAHRYDRIIRALAISPERFAEAQRIIRQLNPRPASGYGSNLEVAVSRIIPDFTVHLHNGELQLWINDAPNLPQLGISPAYLAITKAPIRSEAEKTSRAFASSRIAEARQFIDALKRRRKTLLHVVGAIVQAQEDFFRTGDIQQLRPLVLRQIAETVSLDISSISRITQRKYIQSDYGIYPLKFFFSEGTKGSDGEAVSSRSTKDLLRQLIEKEDKRTPLSDTELGALLSQEGIPIARRTVAKYREQLGIPIARLRREL